MKTSLVERALAIAAEAHKDQLRKEGGIPYIVHPVMVAWKLREAGFTDTVVAAALAHDILEDTEYPDWKLEEELGSEVMRVVRAVTNDDSLAWRDKKKRYIETVEEGGEDAWAVATADKIHNAESLLAAHTRLGEALWDAFKASKEEKLWFEDAMLAMLQKNWNHPLVDEYAALVEHLRAL